MRDDGTAAKWFEGKDLVGKLRVWADSLRGRQAATSESSLGAEILEEAAARIEQLRADYIDINETRYQYMRRVTQLEKTLRMIAGEARFQSGATMAECARRTLESKP